MMQMRGLYAIIDVSTLSARGLSVVEVAGAIARARPAALQLRAKELTARETLHLLRAIHATCRESGVPLFANDRPDLAMLAGCEGVHVGQDDLPVPVVRRIAPMLRIGVSTHSWSEVRAAISSQPDYVAFGPIFETRSKERPDPVVGLEELSKVVANCPLPVVAIGGIDLERAPAIGRTTHLGAVIAGLLPDELESNDLAPLTARARALHAALLSYS